MRKSPSMKMMSCNSARLASRFCCSFVIFELPHRVLPLTVLFPIMIPTASRTAQVARRAGTDSMQSCLEVLAKEVVNNL